MTRTDSYDLARFRTAQDDADSGFECALAEIRAGAKRSHWIWYIFPQLSGLGSSRIADRFAIHSTAEAAEYLRDPVLSGRLLAMTTAVAERVRHGSPIASLMGSRTDALKLVSSLTLFEHVSSGLYDRGPDETYRLIAEAAGDILDAAAAQGYPRCGYTLERLRQ
jgi:uncharacterized protein (DUF1810 family)